MSSNSAATSSSSKAVNAASQTISPVHSQVGPQSNTDGGSQRRAGGSGSFGSGSATRNYSSPRNNQSQRKNHKGQRRARLADEDAYAESTAMKSINSRKGQTSITHLMNFSLPPRPQHHYQPHHRYARRNPTWGLGSGYHAVDKARYVHANYRFIVNPKGDYRVHAVDADVHLDWDMVLQILASAQTQSASCPICLSTPVAPRMAKCGHIFCLPCLIRYMHSTDDTKPLPEKKERWKKCPICWDSVYISETRPVRWFVGQETMPEEGSDIVLRLLTRQPGSTLALPRDGAEALDSHEDIPWYFAAEIADYARVMKGTEDYMTSQYDAEIEELQLQEQEDELMFNEDTTWTRKAVAAITEAKERVKGIGNPPRAPKQPSERRSARPPIKFEAPEEGVPDVYAIQHDVKSGQSSSGGSTTPQSHAPAESAPASQNASSVSVETEKLTDAISYIEPRSMSETRPPRQNSNSFSHASMGTGSKSSTSHHSPDHPFYFYQALPHFYLSPLDIRILKSAFGAFSLFPSTILPRIEHISTGHIADDDLRKRAKYLAHLPHGCEVSFLECDWTDLVNPELLARFSQDIERRRKKNREKDVREEKERVRAEKEEDDKRWAAARRKRPSVTDKSFSESDFQPLAHADMAGLGPSPVDTSITSASPRASSRTKSSSFATLASPSTSPVGPRTVWGTAAVAPSSPQVQPAPQPEDQEIHDDGWLQGWEKDLLDGDDELVAQVAASSIGEGSSKAGASIGTGKKKKNKKITLMSTNARRGA